MFSTVCIPALFADFGVLAFFCQVNHAFEFFVGERQVFGGEFDEMVLVVGAQAVFHASAENQRLRRRF